MSQINRKFCVAPMMTHTDRHFRYFLRLISKHVMLYTEMLTTGALIHGDKDYFLAYNQDEHPLALQLGGSDPDQLQQCTVMAENAGYDEVNLNVGCPSDRVQSGMFGACLMAHPSLVAECVEAMQTKASIPVTVKSRIGIDDNDSYEELVNFIQLVSNAGCKTFFIHARKAWLKGLSPRQNRELPPLKYETVYAIKKDFPDLEIIINGGITTVSQCIDHLQHVDGVMLGRAVCHNPYLLSTVDKEIYQQSGTVSSRHEILQQYIGYIESQLAQGIYLSHMSRHILGLFQGQQGARAYRRLLSEQAHKPGADIQVIKQAMQLVKAA
ncbi:MAG: tRNA dihydrouridine(20/20a) synthase DusA [Gammaproteobacteria bacterium]|jgi:tRNA-dihydrouridine synthase A|nr:tRNA dihydrouridine(20/20a) synthase DusA [Gammaproteobacteria bacterium]